MGYVVSHGFQSVRKTGWSLNRSGNTIHGRPESISPENGWKDTLKWWRLTKKGDPAWLPRILTGGSRCSNDAAVFLDPDGAISMEMVPRAIANYQFLVTFTPFDYATRGGVSTA